MPFPLPITLSALRDHQCKFPISEKDRAVPGHYLFCGAACAATDVYCRDHQGLVWQARKPAASFDNKRGHP